MNYYIIYYSVESQKLPKTFGSLGIINVSPNFKCSILQQSLERKISDNNLVADVDVKITACLKVDKQQYMGEVVNFLNLNSYFVV